MRARQVRTRPEWKRPELKLSVAPERAPERARERMPERAPEEGWMSSHESKTTLHLLGPSVARMV